MLVRNPEEEKKEKEKVVNIKVSSRIFNKDAKGRFYL